HTARMQAAVDACVRAGIGLTAMKTQAKSQWANVGQENETAIKLTDKFMQKGFTAEQAKLKAVWENPNIASICSHMPNMTILQANLAALQDKPELSFNDKAMLKQYARETSHHYCAGCASVCESVVKNKVPIGKVMRYLMYARGYEDRDRAKALFQALSPAMQKRLNDTDYAAAEKVCPRRLAIGRLMREAAEELV
ncbi:MAG: aldo/keto reductase, partial [Gammaproteobacteria bacterium]|nr:aldo/keto reductase [Gammaproteobacteria bacterium]